MEIGIKNQKFFDSYFKSIFLFRTEPVREDLGKKYEKMDGFIHPGWLAGVHLGDKMYNQKLIGN